MKMTLTFQIERSRSFPFLQLQIPYGKHIWNIKLYERQRIVIITKMATIDMHRQFYWVDLWPLTLTFKLLKKKKSQQPFTKPTRQDEHFGI